jgi:hypothetical protein
MAGTNHVVDIYLTGVSPSLVVANPQDTVQWSCPSGPSDAVDIGFATGASITFTGSTPFGSGFGGSVDITNNGTSAKYTIGNEAKSGTYSYRVLTKDEGQSQEMYTASIQVTDDMIVDDGDGIIEVPMPMPTPGEAST